MQAKDVMTTRVTTITPFTPVHDIAALLLQKRISGVPVLDSGALVGVVSESDLLHRHEIGTDRAGPHRPWWMRLLHRDAVPGDYVKSHGRQAKDVMTRQLVCVTEDADLAQVAALLESHHIGRLPVLRGRRLVGIVTRADLVQAVAGTSDDTDPRTTPTDESIRQRLLEELAPQPWWQAQWSNVFVNGGVVNYRGLVANEAARQAARVAAENIAGVRGVVDDRVVSADWQAMV